MGATLPRASEDLSTGKRSRRSSANSLDSINSHPNANFTVIVNPDSGPGNASGPGLDYVSALRVLSEAPNVRTVGYVPTGYGTRDIASVIDEIMIYANWTGKDTRLTVSGIFFDESPHEYSAHAAQYIAALGTAVKSAGEIQRPRMVRNPCPAQSSSSVET